MEKNALLFMGIRLVDKWVDEKDLSHFEAGVNHDNKHTISLCLHSFVIIYLTTYIPTCLVIGFI